MIKPTPTTCIAISLEMQDSQQLRSALNQSVEDMRQMILDVVQSARDDEERMNFS